MAVPLAVLLVAPPAEPPPLNSDFGVRLPIVPFPEVDTDVGADTDADVVINVDLSGIDGAGELELIVLGVAAAVRGRRGVCSVLKGTVTTCGLFVIYTQRQKV